VRAVMAMHRCNVQNRLQKYSIPVKKQAFFFCE
jgi:hypothetical protein